MKTDRKSIEKLRKLKTVADIVGQTDLARLSVASQKVTDLESQINELRTQMHTTEGAGDVLFVPARYRVWIEKCLRSLYVEYSNAVVEQEAARVKLAHSNGRKEVIAKLVAGTPKYPAE